MLVANFHLTAHFAVASLLPSGVPPVLSLFSHFGFSGCRHGAAGSLRPACAVASWVASHGCFGGGSLGPVRVGDAHGIDSAIRGVWASLPDAWPNAACPVPALSVYVAESSRPHHLATRSAALVRDLVALDGCLAAFPSFGCPVGLRPLASPFSGFGSGTWASVALACHLGGAVLLACPSGIVPPSWFGGEQLGGGFYFRPAVVSSSLFTI